MKNTRNTARITLKPIRVCIRILAYYYVGNNAKRI